jgi:hypothetical protein
VARGKNRFPHPFSISHFVGATRLARFSRKYNLWKSRLSHPLKKAHASTVLASGAEGSPFHPTEPAGRYEKECASRFCTDSEGIRSYLARDETPIFHYDLPEGVSPMCRNIKTLYNFDPPVTADEVRAASLQFVRKITGFNKPSQANEAAFTRAVDEIAHISLHLLQSLETTARPKNREEEAAKAKARAAERFGAA